MSKKDQSNKFNFFVPATFEKGITGSSQEMKIKGVCSTTSEDTDGEMLLPTGFDFAPLLQKGFVNWNHQGAKTASAIIGQVTKGEVINDGQDFYIEGYLYKNSAEARSVYELASILENDSPDRRLGFSIEGQAIEKDPINPKIIRRARITGLAITASPKNPNTLLSIMKGEYSEQFVDEDNEAPLINDLVDEYKSWGSNAGDSYGDLGSVQEFLENNHEDHIALKHVLCEAINKAMTAEAADRVTQKESVEGGQKILDNLHNLEKSDIFSQIIDKYDTFDEDIIKSTYSLIEKVNDQINMGNQINQEVINKSFELLEQTSALMKSEEDKTNIVKSDEEKELDAKNEEMSKAMAFAKENIEKGMDENSSVEDLIRKGCSLVVSQTAVQAAVSEYQAVGEGGQIQTLKSEDDSLNKSEENSLNKEKEVDLIKGMIAEQFANFKLPTLPEMPNFSELIKSEVDALGATIGTQFGALSNLLKSQFEQNGALSKQVEDLIKGHEELSKEFKKIDEAPVQKRSVTNIAAIERFEKSQDTFDANTYDLGKKDDREALTTRLFDQYSLIKSQGRDDMSLARAIQDIEGSGTLLPEQQTRVKQLGINVIKTQV